jgi:succinate dehydrogenase / fumarate reductase, cytochrome b subunit
MSPRTGVFSSSVGTKILIGLTGIALFLYLVVHIAGNLLVFFGPAVFNQYSHMLLSNPLIPLIEIGLVVIVALHIYKTVRMFIENQRARPVAYMKKKNAGAPSRKSMASSTMIVSGLWLLLFIVIHVRQFKYGPEYDVDGIRDLYRLEMENFANPLLVGFYALSMLVVGSHLWHGIGSAFQSLGADHPRWTPRLLAAGKVLAVVIAAGFVVIAVWAYVHQIGQVRP